MTKTLVALLAFALAAPVLAATVSWTHPTQYVDNSPLPLADIASTTIEWSNANPFGAVAGTQLVTGSANTATVPSPAPGGNVRCYRAFTTVIGTKGGASSTPSNVACVTSAPFPAPKPPTIIDVLLAFLRRLFGHFA